MNNDYDRKLTDAVKMARHLAKGVEGQIADMTDTDPCDELVAELDTIIKALADIAARFYEQDVWNRDEEGQVEAYYCILYAARNEIDQADLKRLKEIKTTLPRIPYASMFLLKQAAFALGTHSDDFITAYPEAGTEVDGATRIDCDCLAKWIAEKEAE
jgi:hypothetical protein